MRRFLFVLPFAVLLSCVHTQRQTASAPPDAPVAEKIPHRMEKFGDVRIDDYFWLKERENPKVISYLKDENDYVEGVMKPTAARREKLFQEMKARIKEEDSTVPMKKGGYFYYRRTMTGKQYALYARRAGSPAGPEQVLIDENKLAEGKKFLSCSGPQMSPDQNLMAFACDHSGRRFYEIRVRDLRTGRDLPVDIKDVSARVVWANDNRHFFYVKQHPETLRTQWVYRYDLQTGQSTLIDEEKDPTFAVFIDQGLARKQLLIGSFSTMTTEYRTVPLDQPLAKPRVFQPRERGLRYSVLDGGDRFFVITNWRAKNNRLMETPFDRTAKKNWKDVIPARPDVFFDEAEVFKDHLVVKERRQGQDQLHIYDRARPRDPYAVPLLDPSVMISIGGNGEYDSPFLRYDYESLRQPDTTIDVDLRTHESHVRKVKEVPGFNPGLYRTEKIWITVRDGTRVPVDLLMKAGQRLDGSAPLLVYGYGSYGLSLDPWFSPGIFNLIDRGWVYALTHIRGGRELGEAWYENGRTGKKLNTFNDFIDVTEDLARRGYGDRDRIFARGGSAGGLLMGAVMNMRPDLYRGVVAEVPFVDVITTMLDDSIPLTTGEYDEWGNPNRKADYGYIRRYSPYDNLKAAAYPNLLVTTGLHDSQVQYWEPAKWVAKLRTLRTNDRLTLLKTDMTSGHGGASGRYDVMKDEAFVQDFLLLMGEK
ncbi:MAG: S9 family peptidase [Bdellovibrionaceae bacterium]|nr:S9 family peptidase [Pseudobdellovibrionaceae bacterium]